MEEEKDLNVVEEESDFADEVKKDEPAPEAKEEKPVEKAEERMGVNLYNEDNEVDPNFANGQSSFGKKKGPVETFEYEDEDLKNIEDARLVFSKKYKKRNIVKYIITAIVLVGVILGWLLPTLLIDKDGPYAKWQTYTTLIVFVVMLVVLGVYSFISKRKSSKEVNDYMAKYFDYSTKYVLSDLDVQELKGTLADKISDSDLTDSLLYKDVARVGSRGKLTFIYKDVPVTLVECSASKRNGKGYSTIFVGKMLTAANSWDKDPVIVYLKGNKRALPPTNLDAYEMVSDTKTMVVYGKSKKKLLTQKTKEAINKIKTDKVLVDCAISIQPGKTYILMGYEDSLMVPPFDNPFNPNPTKKYKEDLAYVLDVAESLF